MAGMAQGGNMGGDQKDAKTMTAPEFRAALKSLHLSQRSLAERLGVNVTTVNRWAVGKAPVPRYVVYVLELLAERSRLIAAAE